MTQKKTVAEVESATDKNLLAESITQLYVDWDQSRRPWMDQRLELRNYLFATDTSTTSNSTLPWKNSTTRPKLAQIRDNLHANYQSALFPNENWLEWEGADDASVTKAKTDAIRAYMKNKLQEGGFMTTVSELLLDYIDNGNVFYDTVFMNESHTDEETGEMIPGFIGPRLVRVSYRDIVFDPRSATFDGAPKITRYLKTFGQLAQELEDYPDMGYNKDILDKMGKLRQPNGYGLMGTEDYNLLSSYQVDGFGTFYDYVRSGYVEVLVFEGSIWDAQAGKLYKNQEITVIDRLWVAKSQNIPSWLGKSSKGHTAWRKRPDNLYGMGPLDNLVGMQYRIDHLENLKADAQDLAVMPPVVISGNVEDFSWFPGAEIYAGEGAAVTELGKNLNGVISAENSIIELERQMEEMAGAPKEAMGIRTPGEKTAFEVQTLEMAASRIFQQKIRQFELEVLEPALNRMLELARRNLSGSDLVRVMDDDTGVVEFLTITKEDITASGKLRPIGARHFAEKAVLLQNMQGIANSAFGADPGIRVHWSGKKLAQMLLDLIGLGNAGIYGDNIQVEESLQTEHLRAEAVNQLQETNMTPTEPLPPPGQQGGVNVPAE